MESPASPQAQHQRPQHQRRRLAGLLWESVSRARTPRVPFRLGQVLIGDDPFSGRHLGTVAVIDAPYVVRAVAQKNLSRPDDGFADASDPQTYLLGRLNRLYGVPSPKPKDKLTSSFKGSYGFIVD